MRQWLFLFQSVVFTATAAVMVAAAVGTSSSLPAARYSSFQCTAGGQQQFPTHWNFHDETFNHIENRVCMFKNICFDKTHLKYYQHPEERNAPQFVQMYTANLVLLGMFDDGNLIRQQNASTDRLMAVTESAIPEDIPFIDNRTWLFTKATYGHNYMHILLDDMFPALAVMDMFNIDLAESHVTYHGCLDYAIHRGGNPFGFDGVTPLAVACHQNYKQFRSH
jgi:hypothetical protein